MDLTSHKHRKPRTPIIIPPRVAERAVTKSTPDDNGCWISTYSVASHGYAQIGWHDDNSKRWVTTAHRAAWVHAHGQQIPEGYTVDHTCKTRTCVNPTHLRALPNYENARRTHGDDWELGTCKHGHPNSELRVVDGGRRVKCGTCKREWSARQNAKNREYKLEWAKKRRAQRRAAPTLTLDTPVT